MNILLEFIYCVFYVCSITFCVSTYLDRKVKKGELLGFIFLYSLIDYLITQNIFFDLQMYFIQTFLVVISDFLMISLLNRKVEIYIAYYTLIFNNIFNCIVIFITYLLNYIKGFHIILILESSVLRFCLVIFFNILSIIVFRLFFKFKVIACQSNVKENYKILIFSSILVQLVYIIFQWFNKVEYVNGYIHIILLVFIILWILLLYALNHIFILNEEKTKNVFMNGIHENIDQYITYYQQDEERLRKLKHDMKNHFIIMRELKGEESIHNYIDNVYPKLDELKVFNTKQSGNVYVDAIINSKRAQYSSVDFVCHYDIAQLQMDSIDLCMLLFNLMDNACCAAEKINGTVNLYLQYIEPHLVITINNSKEGEVDFLSRKGKNHGYGMKIIDDIVKKYDGTIEYKVLEKEVKIDIVMIIKK